MQRVSYNDMNIRLADSSIRLLTDNFINNKPISSNVESECRLHFKRDKNSFNGITKNQYSGIQIFYSSKKLNSIKENTTVTIYDKNIREVKNNNHSIWYIKEHKHPIDITTTQFRIRFQNSIEEKIPQPTSLSKPISVRIRERETWLYDMKDNKDNIYKYQIDLTKIINDNGFSYEFEIEYLNFKKSDSIYALFLPVYELLHFMIPRVYKYIDVKDQILYDIRDKYDNFTKHINIRKNQPENIKLSDLKTKYDSKGFGDEYTVTNKLNGDRKFIFITGDFIALISKTIDIVYIGPTGFGIDDKGKKYTSYSILDAELYLTSSNIELHVFDCMAYDENYKIPEKGYIHKKSHIERLPIANSIVNQLNKKKLIPNIYMKKFWSAKLAYKCIEAMKDKFGDKYMEENDGLIFTPKNKPYNTDKNDRSSITLKYKFPQHMSIDFRLENTRKKDLGFIADLYVTFGKYEGIFKDDILPSTIELEDNSNDKLIVECLYKNGKWEISRDRDDKESPNYIDVAKNVAYDIKHPISLEDLYFYLEASTNPKYIYMTTNDIKNEKDNDENKYRTFINTSKRNVIRKYASEKVVLDIGSGKGGDLHKYLSANVKFLYAVEPNIEFSDEFIKRIKSKELFAMNSKTALLKFEGEKTDNIKSSIGFKNIPVDIVASFLSLTFFYKNEELLDKFCETICLGKQFIGVMIDGDKLMKFISNGTSNFVKITAGTLEKNKFGQELNISIQIKNSIVQDQTEYLAFYDILKQKLIKLGYIETETYMLDGTGYEERDYIECHRVFAFTFVGKEEKKGKYGNIQIGEFTGKEIKDAISDGIGAIQNGENSILYTPSSRIRALLIYYAMKEGKDEIVESLLKNNSINNSIDNSSNNSIDSWIRNKIKTVNFDSTSIIPMKNDRAIYKCNMLNMDEEEDIHFVFTDEKCKRIGTIAEGSCFFHAIFSSYMTDYNEKNSSGRRKIVTEVRNVLEETLTISEWKKYTNYITNMNIALREKLEDDIDEKTLDNAFDIKLPNKEEYKQQVYEGLKTKIKEETFTKLFEKVENKLFNLYKNKIGNCSEYITYEELQYLSDKLQLNIFILQDTTRLPYVFGDCSKMYKNRSSVILLWVGNNHYERIEVNGKSWFKPEDKIIIEILLFLCGRDMNIHPTLFNKKNETKEKENETKEKDKEKKENEKKDNKTNKEKNEKENEKKDKSGIERPFAKWIIDGTKVIDYSKFDTIDDFSSLMPYQIPQVEKALQKISNIDTVYDFNGHIGVDTSHFAKLFPNAKIISVELDKKVYKKLVANIERLKYKNVITINDDSVKVLNNMPKQEHCLVYFDPPWGGKDYIKNNTLDLFMSGINIIDLVIKAMKKVQYIVVKLPKNYNFKSLDKLNTCGIPYGYETVNIVKNYDQPDNIAYILLIITSFNE